MSSTKKKTMLGFFLMARVDQERAIKKVEKRRRDFMVGAD